MDTECRITEVLEWITIDERLVQGEDYTYAAQLHIEVDKGFENDLKKRYGIKDCDFDLVALFVTETYNPESPLISSDLGYPVVEGYSDGFIYSLTYDGCLIPLDVEWSEKEIKIITDKARDNIKRLVSMGCETHSFDENYPFEKESNSDKKRKTELEMI